MLLLFFRCSDRNFYNLWQKIKSSIVLYFNCIATFLSKKRNINNTDSILDDATLIMVNLFIRSFAKIDDVKMEYSVQITFRQKWSDDRLTYQHRLVGDMESEWPLPTFLEIINQINGIFEQAKIHHLWGEKLWNISKVNAVAVVVIFQLWEKCSLNVLSKISASSYITKINVFQVVSSIWRWRMPAKSGCRTLSSETRKREDSTTFWCPMFILESSLTALCFTV